MTDNMEQYNNLDVIYHEIRQMIKKGQTSLEIKNYLVEQYGYANHTAENYISACRKELKEFYEKDKEHFAVEFNEKYNYLYKKLIDKELYAAAGKILDSQVKISGLLNENTASIKLDENSKVQISFGFSKTVEE